MQERKRIGAALRRLPAPRLSYANVMSSIAVFAVLSGVAYAQSRIGTNDIQNRAVTTAKLDRHAVGTGKLKPRAVGVAKLKNNAVANRSLRGARALQASRTIPLAPSDPGDPANERTILRFGQIEVFGRCSLTFGGDIEGEIGVHGFPGGSARHRIATTGPAGATIGNGGTTIVIERSMPLAAGQTHEIGDFGITITNTDQGGPNLRRGFSGSGAIGLRIDGTDRCFFNASLIGG